MRSLSGTTGFSDSLLSSVCSAYQRKACRDNVLEGRGLGEFGRADGGLGSPLTLAQRPLHGSYSQFQMMSVPETRGLTLIQGFLPPCLLVCGSLDSRWQSQKSKARGFPGRGGPVGKAIEYERTGVTLLQRVTGSWPLFGGGRQGQFLSKNHSPQGSLASRSPV